MPGRQYFDFRSIVPGFVFILLIIGINFVPILRLLENPAFSDSFGAFLAFLTLFSGSAIGFLISQIHWFGWQKDFGIVSHEEYKESMKQFFKKFNIKSEKWTEKKFVEILESKNNDYDEWKRELHTAVDYVSHYKADKKILKMAERRWDIYHTLSTTQNALWMALSSGFIIRLFYHLLFIRNFEINLMNPITASQLLSLTAITVLTIVLFLILRIQKKWLLKISAHLHKTRILHSNLKEEKLAEIFPDLFSDTLFTQN